jgi:hypothetical protein
MRSFAAQFGVELDEAVRYAQANRLDEFFDNRNPVHIDMGSSSPTPLAVAQRSHSGDDLDLQRRRLESHAKRIAMDDGRRPDEPLSLGERLLRHRRRKMLWDAQPVEARSYPVGADLDRFGTPARRDAHGNAID